MSAAGEDAPLRFFSSLMQGSAHPQSAHLWAACCALLRHAVRCCATLAEASHCCATLAEASHCCPRDGVTRRSVLQLAGTLTSRHSYWQALFLTLPARSRLNKG